MSSQSRMLTRAENRTVSTTVGEQHTNVPLVPSLLIGIVGGLATVTLAYLAGSFLPYFHALIMERGPLQYLTVFAFWFAVGMLILKFRNLNAQRAAFHLDFISSFTAGRDVVGTGTILAAQVQISENLDPEQSNLILVNRINKAIKQIRINDNPADVANVLRTVADIDAAVMDTSYIPVRFMIWAIPILGFIGTILGMTQAIGSFDVVLKAINEVGFAGVQENLGMVTGGLSVAFDTTFLALVLSAIVNLFSNALEKREEDFLSDVEVFTTDNIINKYSTVRERCQPAPPPQPASSQVEPGESSAAIVRELRNMNKQHRVDADQMMQQIGRVVEAIEALPKAPASGAQAGSGQDLQPLLEEIGRVLKAQQEHLAGVGGMTALVEKNLEVLEALPAALDETRETSKKLGELFAKIYNRTFQ